ncbi:MAG: TlpA disulfide reductase family protein [Chthoniobacteraceae bacterium]
MNRRAFIQHSCLLAVGILSTPRFAAAGWKENASLPELSSFGLEGAVPNLRGKVVYLDFWASWCAPCKASFPVLNRWQQQLGAKGFTVLGVNVDEKAVEMQDFLKKTPAMFPVVRDAAHKLVGVADVSSMPTSFLIDRKGVIRQVHNGFRPKDEAILAAKIAALLAES